MQPQTQTIWSALFQSRIYQRDPCSMVASTADTSEPATHPQTQSDRMLCLFEERLAFTEGAATTHSPNAAQYNSASPPILLRKKQTQETIGITALFCSLTTR
mmetsp:Transcript_24369/g.67879  ORF Transcript_24369/g.67879 Transcript_24369/m.67879 type:complete len:102 (-) Transcript_24369:103-408(-)